MRSISLEIFHFLSVAKWQFNWGDSKGVTLQTKKKVQSEHLIYTTFYICKTSFTSVISKRGFASQTGSEVFSQCIFELQPSFTESLYKPTHHMTTTTSQCDILLSWLITVKLLDYVSFELIPMSNVDMDLFFFENDYFLVFKFYSLWYPVCTLLLIR